MRFIGALIQDKEVRNIWQFLRKTSFTGDSSSLVRHLSIAAGKCREKFLTFLVVFISEHIQKKFDGLRYVLHKILIPVLEEIIWNFMIWGVDLTKLSLCHP